jgi:uncharacterized protein (TIGR03435 family)
MSALEWMLLLEVARKTANASAPRGVYSVTMHAARRLIYLTMVVTATAWAQTAPTFEVAAIKLSPGHPSGMFPTPGRLTVGNRTLKQLIVEVYRLKAYQIVGADGWMSSIAYDIVGKASSPARMGEMQEMLKTLMAGRFQLTFHRESRELRTYWLVIGKNGPKMRRPDPSDATQGFIRNTPHSIEGHKMNIAQLVYFLGAELDVPLLDKTALEGDYEYKLEWSEDTRPPAAGDTPTAPDFEKPSLFEAVQEQLGLKLEVHPGPVEFLVIDHAEKPNLDN